MLPVPKPAGHLAFAACGFCLYGKGTLITVFTMVTGALSPIALPFSIVRVTLPAVENVIPDDLPINIFGI
jgi:hypothetical protein